MLVTTFESTSILSISTCEQYQPKIIIYAFVTIVLFIANVYFIVDETPPPASSSCDLRIEERVITLNATHERMQLYHWVFTHVNELQTTYWVFTHVNARSKNIILTKDWVITLETEKGLGIYSRTDATIQLGIYSRQRTIDNVSGIYSRQRTIQTNNTDKRQGNYP